MAKTKTWVKKKKRTASPLKPNIFSIQIFPPLRTITKPNNHFKQRFYTKRGIPNPQTSIHTKIHATVSNKFYTLISFFFFLSSFFFFSFFSLLFSSLLLSSLLFRFALAKTKKKKRVYLKAMFDFIQNLAYFFTFAIWSFLFLLIAI